MEKSGMLNGAPVRQDSKKLSQYLATTSACLLALSTGIQMGWTTLLPLMKNGEKINQIPNIDISLNGPLCAIGAAIGAFPSGILADIFGRKKILMYLAGPFLLSWIIIIVTFVLPSMLPDMWYVARVIGGLSAGGTCVLVPIYISEVAETPIRGTLSAFFQLFLILGILSVILLALKVKLKTLSIICGLVEFVFFITFFRMPESPQWLVTKGRIPEAVKALKVLRGNSYDPSEEIKIMGRANDESGSKQSCICKIIKKIFCEASCRRAFICSCSGMILQQFSGVNTVVSNTIEIVLNAISSSSPISTTYYLYITVFSVQVIMGIITALIVDRIGRKLLLVLSSGFLAICLIVLGNYCQNWDDGKDHSSLDWLPSFLLTVFIIAFSFGLGPISWMLNAELNDIKLKGIVSGIAVGINWSLVFALTKLFSWMIEKFGKPGTFYFIGSIMLLAVVPMWFFLLETKGKTLQEIQSELVETGNLRRFPCTFSHLFCSRLCQRRSRRTSRSPATNREDFELTELTHPLDVCHETNDTRKNVPRKNCS